MVDPWISKKSEGTCPCGAKAKEDWTYCSRGCAVSEATDKLNSRLVSSSSSRNDPPSTPEDPLTMYAVLQFRRQVSEIPGDRNTVDLLFDELGRDRARATHRPRKDSSLVSSGGDARPVTQPFSDITTARDGYRQKSCHLGEENHLWDSDDPWEEESCSDSLSMTTMSGDYSDTMTESSMWSDYSDTMTELSMSSDSSNSMSESSMSSDYHSTPESLMSGDSFDNMPSILQHRCYRLGRPCWIMNDHTRRRRRGICFD